MTRFTRTPRAQIDFSLIHGPFVPASVFSGMGVTASMEGSADEPISLRIWRLSPQGIEFAAPTGERFEVGQSLRFVLMMAGQKLKYVGTVVSPGHDEAGVLLVGLKYEAQVRPERPINPSRESREHRRFVANKKFYPTGVAHSPLTFHDSILFTVNDVSSAGMRLSTSMRNKFLVPGLVLTAQIHFPPMAASSVKLRICNIAVVQEDSGYAQCIGARIVERDSAFAEAMGQYILQFGQAKDGVTPKDIEDQNLAVQNHATIVDWGMAETVKDFKDVSALRLITYSSETPHNLARSMTFDDRSRVLIGRFRGQLVACLRVIFCSSDDDRLELESYVDLPKKYLDRFVTAEPSLLCVHPDFQSSNMAIDLIRFAIFVMMQAGRRQALHASAPEMVPFLRRMGFVDTGLRLPESAGGRANWHVLTANIEAIVDGRDVGPVMWNKLFAGHEGHLHQERWHRTGKLGAVRLATYRLIEPAQAWLDKMRLGKATNRRG